MVVTLQPAALTRSKRPPERGAGPGASALVTRTATSRQPTSTDFVFPVSVLLAASTTWTTSPGSPTPTTWNSPSSPTLWATLPRSSATQRPETARAGMPGGHGPSVDRTPHDGPHVGCPVTKDHPAGHACDPAMPGTRRPDRCRRRVHESAAEPRVRAPFDSTCAGLVSEGRRQDCATDARGPA
jgi:hypothetical protein